MKRTTIYLFALGVAVVVIAALGSAGLVASAQNTNSSMTMTNTSKPKPKKPRKKPAAPAMGRCDNTKQEQTDLSGTYTGKAKHGDGPVMDATLTVTGNSFTMATGSDTHTGKIVAVTTCGYTAVSVMPEGSPTAMSLRAKRVGNNLTLTSVPGEPQKVMFTTGGMMKPKPRKHRAKPKTTMTGTETSPKPAAMPKPPKPKATPKPKQ